MGNQLEDEDNEGGGGVGGVGEVGEVGGGEGGGDGTPDALAALAALAAPEALAALAAPELVAKLGELAGLAGGVGLSVSTDISKEPIDPLVVSIEKEATLPQDLVVFKGHLGHAHDPLDDKRRRLYITLQFNEYIEFRAEDVVMFRKLGGEPMDATIVWLKREASIKHVRAQSLDLQRTFLQGDIGLTGNPQGFSPYGQGQMGGGSFYTCGGGSFLTCGGGSFLTCGGGSFLTCGGGSFLTCGGGSFLTCGGGSFLTCGGGK